MNKRILSFKYLFINRIKIKNDKDCIRNLGRSYFYLENYEKAK